MNLSINSGALVLLLVTLTSGQDSGDACLSRFQKGQDEFFLDTDESVKDGATFLSAPKMERTRDCVASCCKNPRCNVALMEKGAEEGLISSCFLFDCLYKQKYACRFVRKKGYSNYILNTVYQNNVDLEPDRDLPDNPPVADAGQDQVVQPQDSVTLNGIQSRDDKGIESYKWDMLTDYPYALIEKTNFPDQIIVSNLTSGMYKFQLTVTDTGGQTDATMITILVLTPEQSKNHCMFPMKIGPCRGAFPRWYHNAASGHCEEFIFGGCKGNLNNYLTKDECTKACYDSGKGGRLLLPPAEEKCGTPCTTEQFICNNGCCLDAGLECDGTPQCTDGSDESNCDELTNKFLILTQIPVDEQKVRCTEHPDTGTCRDSQTKWFYDPIHQVCLPFNYGGCKGNGNRFDSEESCKTTCRSVTSKDVFARKSGPEKQESSDSQTGILAIAILLGVAIVILLGILGYCCLKNKKSSHQPIGSTTKVY
ncbi:kunitz-type protease inhibitor 1a [Nematolebias whitei]|uniref:kunitz-type protease inhibitor 1a n=1 Tax=Nematolebias whitei TaxID=451745 RepID=UPI00189A47F6|nr:kunitz-type protease inhibitor 1a [Nematolebias whitei]